MTSDNLLRLTLVQSDIIWENIDSNLKHLDELIKADYETGDLMLLPEMFTTGFSMNPEKLSEKKGGKTVEWMISKSKELNSAIAGSIIYTENNKYFNRLVWVTPEDGIRFYDKRHLFSMGKEDKYFEKGTERVIISYRGWNICPLICYDLRFPVWSRNNNDYDLLIYLANWPASRNQVWNILLRARAIENQCFVAGVNRVGLDGENIHYMGGSCVVHPKGYLSATAREPVEKIIHSTLNLEEIRKFREKFPVLNDRDKWTIENSFR